MESLSMHPDGVIVGTGHTQGVVKIWDIRTKEVGFETNYPMSRVQAFDFSERGFYFAVGSNDG